MPLKPPPGTQLNKEHQLNKGLMACYPFYNKSGTIVSDISGNKNHGIFVNSPMWVRNKFGSSIKFEESNTDYILAPMLDFGLDSITLFARVELQTVGARKYTVAVGQAGAFPLALLDIEASGQIRAIIEDDATNQVVSTVDGPVLAVNTSYDIAAVFDRTNNLIIRYINGVPISTTDDISSVTGPVVSATGSTRIGMLQDTGTLFDDFIIEVRIYNRALSENKLLNLRQILLVNSFELYAISDIKLWSFVPSGNVLTASDGFELSDSLGMSASVNMSMSDGLELSDTASLISAGEMNMSDNIELSDTFANTVAALMSLSDTVEFSDTAQNVGAFLMSLSDNIVFSDVVSLQPGLVSLTMNDGFTFADALSIVSAAVMGMEDGIVLTDTASLFSGELIEGPITISIQVKQAKFDIVVKKPDIGVTTKQPKFDIEVN